MTQLTATMQRAAGAMQKHRGLVLPCAVAALLLVIFVPLPPSVMDLLLVTNLALAVIVLLTAIYVRTPTEFSVFPTVLLGTTLLRLVLNVATTRLILTAGADGRSVTEATVAAGQVVWTFSHFITRDSLAVGLILFAILIVVQFVVVTKGSTRISEVAARFALDAMPGKQMAVDADLAAKVITPQQATQRRDAIAHEADFFAAMDGASKFLRGDAVAAILITLINIVGGIAIGMLQYGWSWPQTVDLFTRLTIGEGLVMQVPALIVAVGAAVLVTRNSSHSDLGSTMLNQLAARPAVLVTAAIFLGLLALTPLPKLPLLLIGGACAGLAWLLSRRQGESPTALASRQGASAASADGPRTTVTCAASELPPVDPLRVEIGYSLVPLVDRHSAREGDLLARIASIRKQIAGDLGLAVPPVRVCDNMNLDARTYVIKVRGVKVAQGRLYPSQLLAVAGVGETPLGTLQGRATEEPVFGSPAVWISPQQKPAAQEMNYLVASPEAVLVTHLAEVVRRHAAELLSRQQTASLLDTLKGRCPALVGEISGRFSIGTIQKVLQGLLRERVPVHDLENILEAMSDWPGQAEHAGEICEHVRAHLARTLSQQYSQGDGKLHCVSLSQELEEELAGHLEQTRSGQLLMMDAQASARIARNLQEALEDLAAAGRKPVVLCSPSVRRAVRQLISPSRLDAAVLGYNEIENVEIQSHNLVRIES